jgi:hypothetical protein
VSSIHKTLIEIAGLTEPPLRFVAGADAVGSAEIAASHLQQQAVAFRELSSSLAFDN